MSCLRIAIEENQENQNQETKNKKFNFRSEITYRPADVLQRQSEKNKKLFNGKHNCNKS
jgi:hypothetical protein